jgi:hypothetical protein
MFAIGREKKHTFVAIDYRQTSKEKKRKDKKTSK